MTIKEIKFKWDGQGKALSAAEIDFLLSEINRLTAECQKWQEWHDCEYRERKKYRQDANHFAGEVQRLTAELAEAKAYKDVIDEALIVSCIGVASGDARADLHKLLVWEIDVALDPQVSKRAAGLLAEKDAEIEKLTHERDLWENMAAMRLADQEAIERHVTKRVATECAEIAEKMAAACMEDGHCSADVIADKIRENYGVE